MTKLETIASVLGWNDYHCTGSLSRDGEYLSVNDGESWYMVDFDMAYLWAVSYEPNEGSNPNDYFCSVNPYDLFCSVVDMIDPLLAGLDPVEYEGLGGVGGDVDARLEAHDDDDDDDDEDEDE